MPPLAPTSASPCPASPRAAAPLACALRCQVPRLRCSTGCPTLAQWPVSVPLQPDPPPRDRALARLSVGSSALQALQAPCTARCSPSKQSKRLGCSKPALADPGSRDQARPTPLKALPRNSAHAPSRSLMGPSAQREEPSREGREREMREVRENTFKTVDDQI